MAAPRFPLEPDAIEGGISETYTRTYQLIFAMEKNSMEKMVKEKSDVPGPMLYWYVTFVGFV
ncbi:MAG: hypothetical protein Q9171_001767 [Xanthocarpia ochracea]